MPEAETFREAVIRLRRAPAREQLQYLCDAVAPGGHVARVRRLPGGLQCGMHAVDLVTAERERMRLVVRRYTPQQAASDPEVCLREKKTLELLARADAPAPRPVFLDEGSAIFGTPTLVMTRLPGRAFVAFPAEIDPWIEQLAGALVAVHRADTRGPEAAHLPHFTGQQTVRQLEPGPAADRRVAALPEGDKVRDTLLERWPPPMRAGQVLAHGDFFSGNTVWHQGRLSGVVDWSDAVLGPPEIDVSEMRLDLALLVRPEAANRFLAYYENLSGDRAQDLPLWDLMLAWNGSLLLDLWWEAWSDVGTEVSRADLGSRFHDFTVGALRRLD